MSDEKQLWRVGDVCTCEYQGIAGGLLYMVLEVTERPKPTGVGPEADYTMLKIKPVYGVFQDLDNRKVRTIASGWCTPRTLVDLGSEYAKLGNFIRDLAIHRGSE